MSLVYELIKELVGDNPVTAVYGGGFKPPIYGHFSIVEKALKDFPEIDKFIIYVGGGVRDGISQEESLLVWNIYKKYLGDKVEIVPSKGPIGDVIRYGKNNPEEIVYFVIGGREGREDDALDIEMRTKGVEDKYPNMKVKVLTTSNPEMSGTNARKAIKVSEEEFYKFLPPQLTDEEKMEVYTLVSPVVKEQLNENASYSKDIDIIEKCAQLTNYMRDKGYKVDPLPSVEFVNGDTENAKDFFGKTAYYDPNEQKIVLYTEGRHPKDIVRSYSHEMIHHIQNLEGRLGNISTQNTQEDDKLNDIEAEANLKGTMTFRNWTDSLNEIGDASAGAFPYNQSRIDIIVNTLKDKIEDQPDAKWRQHLLPFLRFSSPNADYEVITTAQVDKPLNIPDFQTRPNLIELRVDFMVGESDEATNIGEQYKVMATMTQIIKELIDKISKLEGSKLRSVRIFPKSDDGNEEADVNSKRGKLYQAYVKKNLPSGWDMSTGKDARGGSIVLYPPLEEGFNKKLGKDPFGLNQYARELAQGLEESLNEGRYDSISRQLASIALNAWKSDFKDGASYGYFTGEITPEEYPTDLTFTFKALGRFVDGGYKHNGYSRADGEVGVKYEIPKDAIPQIWEEVYMDLISTIRHEIEHQTQGGKNVKQGKGMTSDQKLRQLIKKGGGDIVRYVTLPKEIESNVHGLYLKAKKWRRPYDEVVDEYIKDFLKITNPADVSYVKNKWQSVAKKRNLPSLLNEGAYDSLTTKLTKATINKWVEDSKKKPMPKKSFVDIDIDEFDGKGREIEFNYVGIVEFDKKIDGYEVDGTSNSGEDKGKMPFVATMFKINPKILPQAWSKISADVSDVIRHEIEHLTQAGDNTRSDKYMEDDIDIRDMINKLKILPQKNYYMLEKEVDAMLQGLYLKAKKTRKPFADVINNYLDMAPGIETPEDKEMILNLWRSRRKALSLPVFETKYKLGKVMREQEETTEQKYQIYCDMDGVLTDFDTQFKELSGGVPPGEYEDRNGKDAFWALVAEGGVGYWVGMPWMPNGKQLWEYISKYNPIILSAPSKENESRLGKRLWVRNNLSPKPKLILASAANKPNYSGTNRILIDDRPDTIANWNSQGGIGILFKSTAQVIEELKKLGL